MLPRIPSHRSVVPRRCGRVRVLRATRFIHHPIEEYAMSRSSRARAVVLAALTVLTPAALHAQAVLKVNDSVSVRFGFLSQTWADFEQNSRQDTSYAQSI